jgi:fumarate reductase subunit D
MHYNIIFDITQTTFHLWLRLVGCFVFIIMAIGFFWLHRKIALRTGLVSFSNSVLTAIFLLVVSLLPIFMLIHSHRYFLELKAAMQQSQCQVAEGIVSQFQHQPQSKGSGVGEMFVVDGKQFRYRDGSAQMGFHQIGLIRDGMQVRIFYYDKVDPIDKDITRLEIAQ